MNFQIINSKYFKILYCYVINYPQQLVVSNSHLFCSWLCGAGIQGGLSWSLVSAPPGISWGSRGWRAHLQDGFFTHSYATLSVCVVIPCGLGFTQHGHLRKFSFLPHWLSSKGQEVVPASLVNVSPKTGTSFPSYLLDKSVTGPT